MILTEYDEEEFRKALREELLNEGLIEGACLLYTSRCV